MPDRGGQGEDALGDAGADAADGLAPVAFDVELGLEGGVDGLDDLTQRLEELLTRTRQFARAGLAEQVMPASSILALCPLRATNMVPAIVGGRRSGLPCHILEFTISPVAENQVRQTNEASLIGPNSPKKPLPRTTRQAYG
jgi:hypothetical protein